jgi:hypothetical protein
MRGPLMMVGQHVTTLGCGCEQVERNCESVVCHSESPTRRGAGAHLKKNISKMFDEICPIVGMYVR